MSRLGTRRSEATGATFATRTAKAAPCGPLRATKDTRPESAETLRHTRLRIVAPVNRASIVTEPTPVRNAKGATTGHPRASTEEDIRPLQGQPRDACSGAPFATVLTASDARIATALGYRLKNRQTRKRRTKRTRTGDEATATKGEGAPWFRCAGHPFLLTHAPGTVPEMLLVRPIRTA